MVGRQGWQAKRRGGQTGNLFCQNIHDISLFLHTGKIYKIISLASGIPASLVAPPQPSQGGALAFNQCLASPAEGPVGPASELSQS